MAADLLKPIPSAVPVVVPGVEAMRSRVPAGLVVAALVESAWLLFLGWMAVRGA